MLCVSDDWFLSENSTSNEAVLNTRLKFLNLLNDFRQDTPEFIIFMFKNTVIFSTSWRFSLDMVNYFLFFRGLLLGGNPY